MKVEQVELLDACPTELPIVEGLTGVAIMKGYREWALQYEQCRIKSDGLIKAVKGASK